MLKGSTLKFVDFFSKFPAISLLEFQVKTLSYFIMKWNYSSIDRSLNVWSEIFWVQIDFRQRTGLRDSRRPFSSISGRIRCSIVWQLKPKLQIVSRAIDWSPRSTQSAAMNCIFFKKLNCPRHLFGRLNFLLKEQTSRAIFSFCCLWSKKKEEIRGREAAA